MLSVLPGGRRVPFYYQMFPVLGFMIKRIRDGLYWDQDAVDSERARECWVAKFGTLHKFEDAKWLMRQFDDACELEIVVDRQGLTTKSHG